jgi:hypothetical protein
MSKEPDRLYIDKNDRKLYENIELDENGDKFFEGKTRKDQFIFAMATGFINNVHQPLDTKENFFLTKDLRREDEAIINAVALFANDIEILKDTEKVFKIAEEYAHAGVNILNDKIKSTVHGSFWKHYEKDLHESYNKYSRR